MPATLSSAFDLALVVIGFGLVIFVHELGHFVAARWAGVRVEQFALGFGSAIFSYRRGLGWRRGSTRRAYAALTPERQRTVGATEYRLNWFPLGGYVKMFGQDDLSPTPASLAARPDAYPAAPPWKRMIIISAGVVMNLILAASLFVLVFMIGLRFEAPVVGFVSDGSGAARATAIGGAGGVAQGLKPGDRIVRLGDRSIRTFNDVMLTAAMAQGGRPMRIVVERGGRPMTFEATPEPDATTRLLDLGVGPASAPALLGARGASKEALEGARRALDGAGLVGVDFGATLVSVGGAPVSFAHELEEAVERAVGEPVKAVFRNADGKETEVALRARPRLQAAIVTLGDATKWPVGHVGGLLAPTRVAAVSAIGTKNGLREGDVLARVGAVEWPDIASAVREIRRHERKTIQLAALRDGAIVEFEARVSPEGTIGFAPAPLTRETPGVEGAIVAGTLGLRHPDALRAVNEATTEEGTSEADADPATENDGAGAMAAPSEGPPVPPGAIVLDIAGKPVKSLEDIREALRGALAAASGANAGGASVGAPGRAIVVSVRLRLPLGARFGEGPEETIEWTIPGDAARALAALGWRSPVDQTIFELAKTMLKAKGPVEAVAMGVRETNRVMMTTYLTLRRLVEGSVKVEHMKGPVGIAHLGTMVASQGSLQLLFFLALISVNLAVINFLPLPIVDGGQFVFLLWEAATGRRVSEAVQSATIVLGVVMIGAVFLIVTFNDVTNLVR